MRAFLRTQHGKLAGTLLAFFIIAVTLRLHGFSLPIWHRVLGGAPASEVLAGKPRDIRSDHWLLELPIALGQLKTGFRDLNPNIGAGQNIVLPYRTPIRGPLELFRPYTWGFFLGPEAGLSWMWWMSELGLLYALFLAFRVIAPRGFWAPLLAAAGIVASPCLQYWSFQNSEPYAHGALAFAAFAALLRARRRPLALALGVLMGWAMACAALENVYPPAIVGAAWIFGALSVAHAVEQRARPGGISRILFVGAAAAGLVLAGAAAAFLYEAGPALEQIQQTSYPGQRVSLGGGKPLWTFFVDHFFVSRLPDAVTRSLGNVCEAGSFLLFFPLVVGAAAASARLDATVVASSLVILLQGWFCIGGLSPLVAKYTLLAHSQPGRPVLAIGIASGVMVLRYLEQRQDYALGPVRQGALLAAALAALLAEALVIHGAMPENGVGFLAFATLLQLLLCTALIVPRLAPLFLLAQLSVLVPYTLRFNPLVQGGVRTLEQTPLAGRMSELQAASPEARWAVFGDDERTGSGLVLANFPRMIGIPSIGGFQCPPQRALWAAVGLTGAALNVCGYFSLTPAEGPARVERTGLATVLIRIDPDALRPLGVRYALVTGGPALFKGFARFRLVADLGPSRVYDLAH